MCLTAPAGNNPHVKSHIVIQKPYKRKPMFHEDSNRRQVAEGRLLNPWVLGPI